MISRRTHEEWKELVLEFNNSGLNMTRFCEGLDLKASTFIYWFKKFNQPSVKATKLVKLQLKNITKSATPIQITIDDIKFELPSYMTTDKISKIISAIREII